MLIGNWYQGTTRNFGSKQAHKNQNGHQGIVKTINYSKYVYVLTFLSYGNHSKLC